MRAPTACPSFARRVEEDELQTETGAIGIATSPDGVSWTRQSENPVLEKAAGSTWPNVGVFGPHLMVIDREYRLYFAGSHSDGSPSRPCGTIRIGVALPAQSVLL